MTLLEQRDPRYVVVYPDGKKLEKMDKHTARNYVDIFGGKVICAVPKKNLIKRLIKKIRSR